MFMPRMLWLIRQKFIRDDLTTCKLHLSGLRAIVTRRQQLALYSSPLIEFKVSLLVSRYVPNWIYIHKNA